jgi:hypothetical protein
MSFREYVTERYAGRNINGDFIRDCRADDCLPDVRSWGELGHYLNSVGACDVAIHAGRRVWRAYVRKQARTAAAKAAPPAKLNLPRPPFAVPTGSGYRPKRRTAKAAAVALEKTAA